VATDDLRRVPPFGLSPRRNTTLGGRIVPPPAQGAADDDGAPGYAVGRMPPGRGEHGPAGAARVRGSAPTRSVDGRQHATSCRSRVCQVKRHCRQQPRDSRFGRRVRSASDRNNPVVPPAGGAQIHTRRHLSHPQTWSRGRILLRGADQEGVGWPPGISFFLTADDRGSQWPRNLNVLERRCVCNWSWDTAVQTAVRQFRVLVDFSFPAAAATIFF